MTLIVGIKCGDGVVVASDSAATMGDGFVNTIGQQEVKKIHELGTGGVFASTGSVGMAQLLHDQIGGWCNQNLTRMASGLDAMKGISEQIRGIVVPQLQASSATVALVGRQAAATNAVCKTLAAVVVKKEAHLFQFDYAGAPELATPEVPFVAMGSGQSIADPFLAFLRRVLWGSSQPTVAQGRLAAAWAVSHVCRTNPGGVGPPLQMATLRVGDDGAPIRRFDRNEELLEAVHAAEAALRDHVSGASTPAAPEAPAPPTRPATSESEKTAR